MTFFRINHLLHASLLAAAATLALDATAGPTNVPFKASVAILEYVQPNTGPASGCGMVPLVGMSIGVGTASHLGKIVTAATDCIAPTSASSFGFSNGKLTFTAANGDTLRAEYMGSLVSAGGPAFAFNGATFRFVGGTGRFEHATGGGELRGGETLSADPTQASKGQLEAIGTMSY